MLPLFWLSPFSCRPGVRWTNDRHHDCADIGFTNRHLLLQGRAGKDWWKKEEIKNSTRHFAYLWVSTWEHHEFLDHYIYIYNRYTMVYHTVTNSNGDLCQAVTTGTTYYFQMRAVGSSESRSISQPGRVSLEICFQCSSMFLYISQI